MTDSSDKEEIIKNGHIAFGFQVKADYLNY